MAAPRRSRTEWRALLDRQARSGLSISAFAKREGIRPQTLSWWRWRLGSASPQPSGAAPRFVQLEMEAPPRDGYELELGDEVLLRIPCGFDEQELARVFRALRELC